MVNERGGNCHERMCYQAQLDANQGAAHNPNPSDTTFTDSSPTKMIDLKCSGTKIHHEPLAWSLDASDALLQSNSPLFTSFPLEIREMIYSYALKDTSSYPIDHLSPKDPIPAVHMEDIGRNQITASLAGGRPLCPSDVAISLLLTCKRVYLETWNIPLRENSYRMDVSGRVRSTGMLAWQLALIRKMDVTLKQRHLERGHFVDALQELRGVVRHRGAYPVPKNCFRDGGWAKFKGCSRTIGDNCLVRAGDLTDKHPQRLVDILARLDVPEECVEPSFCNLRVTAAQPLKHLTIRLTRTDWSTWDVAKRIHLDPTFQNRQPGEPSARAMHLRAAERAAGRYPQLPPQSWGAQVVSTLPDLETLELVLEMFKDKEEQLDSVVQCAKTWRFGGSGEAGEDGKRDSALVWDGEVVERRWKREGAEKRYLQGEGVPAVSKASLWHLNCNDFEVRIVRYVRNRVEE
jgi:hypothetical protein